MSRAAKRLSDAAPLFAALGDETRLRLVSRLSMEGPLSIRDLSDNAKISRQAITKHLQLLSDAGLVKDEWRGRERVFELEKKRVEKAREALDQISAQWDAAIDRLKTFVETPSR
jgi:DNA-binding transcriptional ArsR family regulator